MTTKWRLVACTLVGAAALGLADRATAIELLTAGDFETTIGAVPQVPSWTLQEFRAVDPNAAADTASLEGFANSGGSVTGEFGLWVKAFAGNPTAGLATMILSQAVPAVPGETYSFKGEALFETYYSGGVETLEAGSLFGAIPSPTRTEFELSFLDAGGAVIGTPVIRNLKNEVFNGFGYTAVTPISDVAPANAASVRVRAMGIDMANNQLNPQSAFMDNFSLTTLSAPSTELLANARLNEAPEVAPTPEEVLSGIYDFIEVPETSVDIVRVASFANNPATGGVNGIWISPFDVGGQGGSGTVAQTVPGSAGTEYTFSAGARWETNFFSGPGANEAVIELSFLDGMGEVIGSSVLDLRDDGKTADNNWSTHSVSATAPEGTVDVRVAGIISNLTTNPAGGAQSAFWDDFSLMAADTPSLPGDTDGNGVVDLVDLNNVKNNFGAVSPPALGDTDGNGTIDLVDLNNVKNNFGATLGAVSVPEPASALLVLAGVAIAATRRRV
jgi:hypothetical protein